MPTSRAENGSPSTGVFLQRRAPGPSCPRRRGHLDPHLGRIRQQHLVLDDLDLLEPVVAPPIAHPFGEHAIARRAGDVRIRGQEGVRLARPLAATGAARKRRSRRRSAAADRGAETQRCGERLASGRRRDQRTQRIQRAPRAQRAQRRRVQRRSAAARNRCLCCRPSVSLSVSSARLPSSPFSALTIARAASAPERPSKPVPGMRPRPAEEQVPDRRRGNAPSRAADA